MPTKKPKSDKTFFMDNVGASEDIGLTSVKEEITVSDWEAGEPIGRPWIYQTPDPMFPKQELMVKSGGAKPPTREEYEALRAGTQQRASAVDAGKPKFECKLGCDELKIENRNQHFKLSEYDKVMNQLTALSYELRSKNNPGWFNVERKKACFEKYTKQCGIPFLPESATKAKRQRM